MKCLQRHFPALRQLAASSGREGRPADRAGGADQVLGGAGGRTGGIARQANITSAKSHCSYPSRLQRALPGRPVQHQAGGDPPVPPRRAGRSEGAGADPVDAGGGAAALIVGCLSLCGPVSPISGPSQTLRAASHGMWAGRPPPSHEIRSRNRPESRVRPSMISVRYI